MSQTRINTIGGTNTTTKRRHRNMGTTPYEFRIEWTREEAEILKQRLLEYICSQPNDNTYYTNNSSDKTRATTTVVHKEEEEIINRLNDSASILDAEITAIRVAIENASETRHTITIHTYSLTAVIHTTVNTNTFREQTKMKKQIARYYNEQAYNDASQQTKDHRQLHQTDSSRRKLISMPRKVQRSIWRRNMRCPTYTQVTTGQPLRHKWCNENYNSITEHWVRHCPAMVYWQ